LLSVSAFAQQGPAAATDNPDPTAQANSAVAEQKPNAAAFEEARTAALAKAAQNPVADMISFPLQNNTNFNVGPYSRDQDVLNIQPVIRCTLRQSGT
jgi:hypothetical protein